MKKLYPNGAPVRTSYGYSGLPFRSAGTFLVLYHSSVYVNRRRGTQYDYKNHSEAISNKGFKDAERQTFQPDVILDLVAIASVDSSSVQFPLTVTITNITGDAFAKDYICRTAENNTSNVGGNVGGSSRRLDVGQNVNFGSTSTTTAQDDTVKLLFSMVSGGEANAWTVLTGDCKVEGMCITSPNYPESYTSSYFRPVGQSLLSRKSPYDCEIDAEVRMETWVDSFETADYSDVLRVNGVSYSGTAGPNDGLIPTRRITWSTSLSTLLPKGHSRAGWKICAGEKDEVDGGDGGDGGPSRWRAQSMKVMEAIWDESGPYAILILLFCIYTCYNNFCNCSENSDDAVEMETYGSMCANGYGLPGSCVVVKLESGDTMHGGITQIKRRSWRADHQGAPIIVVQGADGTIAAAECQDVFLVPGNVAGVNGQLQNGSRVQTAGTDGTWYAGAVQSIELDGQVTVKFDDGDIVTCSSQMVYLVLTT